LKKLAFVSLIAVAVFFLTACVQDPFEEYENFVNDLDINARIEDAITSVSQGDTSPFFEDEVNTLYGDLGTFEQEDDKAHEINGYYSDSVKDLLDSIDFRKKGKTDLAESALNQALDAYQAGQGLYQAFLRQYNHNNARTQ
jgi:hypothetical protein